MFVKTVNLDNKFSNSHLKASVNELFFIKLFEHPPHTFHESDIQRFVIILEVNPSSQTAYNLLPFGRITHDNLTAFSIVLRNTQSQNVITSLDTQHLIYFKLDGETFSTST